jgi:hypothetical protein
VHACHDVGAVSTSRDSTPLSPLSELNGKDLADVVCLKNCIGCRGDELSEVRKPAVIAILLDQLSDRDFGQGSSARADQSNHVIQTIGIIHLNDCQID